MPKKLNKRFLVILSEAHHKSGQTIYEVAKRTGISYNTVRRYVLQPLVCELIPPEVYLLARHYGVRNEDAVQLIDIEESESEKNSPDALPVY